MGFQQLKALSWNKNNTGSYQTFMMFSQENNIKTSLPSWFTTSLALLSRRCHGLEPVYFQTNKDFSFAQPEKGAGESVKCGFQLKTRLFFFVFFFSCCMFCRHFSIITAWSYQIGKCMHILKQVLVQKTPSLKFKSNRARIPFEFGVEFNFKTTLYVDC